MIYFLIDGSDFSEQKDLIVEAIQQWLEESRSSAQLINREDPHHESQWLLGLEIDTKRPKTLAKPMDFLYSLAQEYEQEFVVGLSDENQQREDVCYFGFEEGKPSLDEITMYLGL